MALIDKVKQITCDNHVIAKQKAHDLTHFDGQTFADNIEHVETTAQVWTQALSNIQGQFFIQEVNKHDLLLR